MPDSSRPQREYTTAITIRVPKDEPRDQGRFMPDPERTHSTPFEGECEISSTPLEQEVGQSIVEPRQTRRIFPSLWYLGVQVGQMYPSGDLGNEYKQGNSSGLMLGFVLPNGFGVEFQYEIGSFAGEPQFDYVTTTQSSNGGVKAIREVPEQMTAEIASFGIRASYQERNQQLDSYMSGGWSVGASIRYSRFSEEVTLQQETYLNEMYQGSRSHTVIGSFGRPVFGVDVTNTGGLSTLWWVDLIARYDFSSRQPQRLQPTAFDWNEYKGQLSIAIALRVKIAEIGRF